MPELPDIETYLGALRPRILSSTLEKVHLNSLFLLRTVDPQLAAIEGQNVRELRRIGKRIAIGFDNGLWLVIHLMIAGRLHWYERSAKRIPRGLATLSFTGGTLVLTEAGTQRRAAFHVVSGESGLSSLDPGGLEVLQAGRDRFAEVLRSSNHTLKRALTDPHLFSGIGNAYSDEILFAARLSPLKLSQKLDDNEITRLFDAARTTLTAWIDRLRQQTGDGFPEKVTAFHPEMAVHGRYRQPCMNCGARIQRIRYAANEANYCARCQTGGKLLSDRALSRLMHADWPRSLDELELLIQSRKA
ncbi:MAG TPA: DNA-formamidopyrimidine glycosylase family protein [Candidatus Binataceae bacterium]|nr:DNA-formamidopyrimidine glycosylase family protein [Candidatus Binataceae bacterium]